MLLMHKENLLKDLENHQSIHKKALVKFLDLKNRSFYPSRDTVLLEMYKSSIFWGIFSRYQCDSVMKRLHYPI